MDLGQCGPVGNSFLQSQRLHFPTFDVSGADMNIWRRAFRCGRLSSPSRIVASMVVVSSGIPERVAQAIDDLRAGDPLAPVDVVTGFNPRRLAHELALRRAWANVRCVSLAEAVGNSPDQSNDDQACGRVVVGPRPQTFLTRPDDVVIDWAPSVPKQLRVRVATDATVEARAALAEIAAAHRCAKSWERLAIAWSSSEPYAPIVARLARRGEIPVHIAAQSRASQSAAGRAALALLRVWAADYDRRSVAALWQAAPLLDPLTGGLAPIVRWDALSRRERVIAGESWNRVSDQSLRAHIEQLRTLAPADFGDENEVAAALATSLLSVVVSPRSYVAAELFGARSGREADALDVVLAAVAGLARSRRRSDDPHRPWSDALAAVLQDRVLGAEGRIGEGVQCGSIESLALGTFDLVCVLGASEAMDGRDDDQRARRASALAALSAAPLFVTVPLADMRADREALPSPLVLSWLASRAGRSVDARTVLASHPNHPDVLRIPSHWSTLVGPGAMHLGTDEIDLDDAARFVGDGYDLTDHPCVANSAAASSIRANRARRGSLLSNYDGLIEPHPAWQPRLASWTVTALERAAACPLRFLLDDVLGARPLVAPEDDAEPDARHSGTMVHDALDDLTAQWLALDRTTRDPFGQWLAAQRHRVEQIIRERMVSMAEQGALAPGPAVDAVARSVATRLRTHLNITAQDFTNGWSPYASEPRLIGNIDTPFGPVLLRGGPDRIDVNRAEDRLRIVDHKTGRLQEVTPGRFPDAIDDGSKVQLPLYALLALQNDTSLPKGNIVGWYQHPLRPLGATRQTEIVLRDSPSGQPDLLDRAAAAVGRTVEAMQAGLFIARTGDRPGDDAHCRFCHHRPACPVDIVHQTQRKAAARPGYETEGGANSAS